MSTPPPEDFEQVSKRLHTLARTLTQDEASAEDLVQETWTVALGSRPESVRDWAPWLAGVLRRLARRRSTVERRRRQIEELASRPVDLREERLLEHIDIYRWLEQSVERLPEPYRGVLRLRFFGDCSHRDIARKLGRPLETVRSQIQRGLDLLRERIDPDQAGIDWRAFFGFAPRGSRRALRSRALTLLLGLGLVGGIVYITLLASSGPEAPSVETPTVASLPGEPAGAPSKDEVGRRVAVNRPGSEGSEGGPSAGTGEDPEPAGPEPAARLVRVVDPGGIAVPGADVRICGGRGTFSLLPTDERERLTSAWPQSLASRGSALGSGTTDSAGRVLLSIEPAWIGELGHGVRGIILVASHPTRGTSDRAFLEVESGSHDEVEMVLAGQGADLEIRVKDSDLGDVPGASVFVVPRNLEAPRTKDGILWSTEMPWTTTDEEGRAKLPGVRPGPHELRIFRADFVRHQQVVTIAQDPLDLEVTLERGCSVVGRLVSPSGEPIPGARVWVSGRRHGGRAITSTDGEGHFQIHGIPEGRRYLHADDGNGLGADELHEVRMGETLTWNPPMRETEFTRLRVTTFEGHAPSPGSSVALFATVGGEVWMHREPLDAEGCASLAHFPSEPTTLMILTPESSALGRAAVERLVPDPRPAEWAVQLEPPHAPEDHARLMAEVPESKDASLAPLWVEVHSLERTEMQRSDVDRESRLVELHALRPGKYRIRLHSASAGCAPLGTVELQPGETLDLGEIAVPRSHRVDPIAQENPGARGRLEQRLEGGAIYVIQPDWGSTLPPLFPGSFRWVPADGGMAIEFKVP